jgi:serine/threonine protein kinase
MVMPDTGLLSCPPPAILEALARGELEQARTWLEHIDACPGCQGRFQALLASPATLRTVATPTPPVPTSLAGRLTATLGGAAAEARLVLRPPVEEGEIGRLGPYPVQGVLAAGGMGLVFAAFEPELRRPIALKVMRPQGARDERVRQRFLREAEAMAAVHHENVVPVFRVGEDRDVPFLVMPLLEGETLAGRLERDGSLAPDEAVEIARQVAEGLAAAHARGLVHRDVKPANVWLAPRGRVLLMDFGLVRPLEAGAGELTTTGRVMGTPAYMAPEQARGEPVDARSDLFALGCVLYRMVTGRPPYPGDDVRSVLESACRGQTRPIEPGPGATPALARLVGELLQADPARRPASARSVADALAALRRGESLPVHGAGRWVVGLAVGCAVLAIVLTGFLVGRLWGG